MFRLIPWRNKEAASEGSLVPQDRHPLLRVRDEFDALFDRFFGSWSAPFGTEWGSPAGWGLDLEDTENEVVFRAEAPGFEADDFDVEVSGNWLTIEAESKPEAGTNGGTRRGYRQFRRSVTLPAGVDADHVQAWYRNGILEVRLPKTAEARGRRIKVQT